MFGFLFSISGLQSVFTFLVDLDFTVFQTLDIIHDFHQLLLQSVDLHVILTLFVLHFEVVVLVDGDRCLLHGDIGLQFKLVLTDLFPVGIQTGDVVDEESDLDLFKTFLLFAVKFRLGSGSF